MNVYVDGSYKERHFKKLHPKCECFHEKFLDDDNFKAAFFVGENTQFLVGVTEEEIIKRRGVQPFIIVEPRIELFDQVVESQYYEAVIVGIAISVLENEIERKLLWDRLKEILRLNKTLIFDHSSAVRAGDLEKYPDAIKLGSEDKRAFRIIPAPDAWDCRFDLEVLKPVYIPQVTSGTIDQDIPKEQRGLIAEMYAGLVSKVHLDREICGGMSNTRVFVVKRDGKISDLVKIGEGGEIRKEIVNYKRYSQALRLLRRNTPVLTGLEVFSPQLGVFSADLIHASTLGKDIHDLQYHIEWGTFDRSQLKLIIKRLFEILKPLYEYRYDEQTVDVKDLYGRMMTTERQNRIIANASDAFVCEPDRIMNLDYPEFPIARGNPLVYLPILLGHRLISAHTSIIYGDLNLRNIFVPDEYDAESARDNQNIEDIILIDLAELKRGHLLFDFAELEVEILIRLLVGSVKENPEKFHSLVECMEEFIKGFVPGNRLDEMVETIPEQFRLYFDLIINIRDVAMELTSSLSSRHVKQTIEGDRKEYLIALFFESLYVVSFNNLESWARKLAFITAGIAGKCICENMLKKEPI